MDHLLSMEKDLNFITD